MSALFGRFWVDDQGQDIEYAVMLAVVDEDVT
jgi:Flp pilus assembly pilin Flp